jgi:hypothetical protein
VSIFYHKPNSDMWQSQRGFFLAPRAPHSRRHFTERASLEVRTRDAHRRDGYRRERRRGFFYFISLNHAHPRFGGRRVRSFVRSIVRSINRRRANAFRILSFPGTTDGCAFAPSRRDPGRRMRTTLRNGIRLIWIRSCRRFVRPSVRR